jgi:hypothetical protein
MSDPLPGLQGMVQASTEAKEPIPLDIVATGPGDDGMDEVVLEDPEGYTFTIPRRWIPKDVFVDGPGFLPHTSIKAPPGELEAIWRRATAEGKQEKDPGGYGGETGSAHETQSLLDDWKSGALAERMAALGQGGYVKGGVPMASESVLGIAPTGQTVPMLPSWAKSSRTKRTNNFTAETIPPEAGTGWGNADETWNPRTQRWEKAR